jgi:hypothetical protein
MPGDLDALRPIEGFPDWGRRRVNCAAERDNLGSFRHKDGQGERMPHHIVLDPSLGLTAGQFAMAWNDEPESRKVATAEVAADPAQAYDPTLAEMVNLIVVPLALGVAGNALYDLIKHIVLQAGVRRRTQIVNHMQPDGSELTIITIEEEA